MSGLRSRGHGKPAEEKEDWLLTYADMITLLMAFFILLLSMSKIDASKYEEVQQSMAKEIGKRDVMKPIETLKLDVKDAVNTMGLQQDVGVGSDAQGVTIELPAAILFAPGSAELRPEAVPVLRKMGVVIDQPGFANFVVEVQGHTDDTPVRTAQFPSNWELSTARASAALRVLVDAGLAATRLKAVGFADVQPKVPNHGPDGNPVAINQAINRRVVIRVSPR